MKHYKDSTDTIYAIEDDGSQDFLVKPDWILLTQDELTAMRAPTPEQAASQAQAVADAADKDTVKVAPVIKYLLEHTGQDCANYVHAQVNSSAVTDLASAKAALGKLENIVAELARGLSIIAKQNLR